MYKSARRSPRPIYFAKLETLGHNERASENSELRPNTTIFSEIIISRARAISPRSSPCRRGKSRNVPTLFDLFSTFQFRFVVLHAESHMPTGICILAPCACSIYNVIMNRIVSTRRSMKKSSNKRGWEN